MYTSIVTINESVIICMYVNVFMTRNCTVYDNKIYVLFCLKLQHECRSLCTILSSKSANIAQSAVLCSLNWSQLVLISDRHLKEMRPLIGNWQI